MSVPNRVRSLMLVIFLSVGTHPLAHAGLLNPSFELNALTPGVADYTIWDASNVPGWKTTATDNKIEVWSDGFGGFTSFQGNQHVELNAFEVSTLYQDATGIPANATVGFQFAHRGRLGDDVLRLTITDLGADGQFGSPDDAVLFTKEYSDNTAWGFHQNPPNQPIVALGHTVRFEFISVSATGDNQAIGNFIDDADFGVDVGLPACPDSLQAFYTFDDSTNRGRDSANNFDGTRLAATIVAGHCGTALRFRPDNNVHEFTVPSSPGLNMTGAMSASAYVRIRGTQSTDYNPGCSEGTIFAKGGANWFQVERDNDRLVFQNEPSGNEVAIGFYPFPINEWTQVGFVRGPWTPGGQSIQFYVNCDTVHTVVYENGVPTGTNLLHNAAFSSGDPLMLGNHGFGNSPEACEFNGDIDELRLFDRALADADYRAICACPCSTSADPCVEADSVVLNTGWDQQMNDPLATNAADNEWFVTLDVFTGLGGHPAYAEPNNPSGFAPIWAAPQPNSQWVVPDIPLPFFNPGAITRRFEYRFCLSDTNGVTVSLSARTYPYGNAWMNDVRLNPVTLQNNSLPNQSPSVLVATAPSLFKIGENVLAFTIDGSAIDVGLNVVGSIHGPMARKFACCSESTGTVTGHLWSDRNSNSKRDPNDPALVGWVVHMTGPVTADDTTDATGTYAFARLPAGTYTITQGSPAGFDPTYPHGPIGGPPGSYQVIVDDGEVVDGLDFGRHDLGPAGVGDRSDGSELAISRIHPNPLARAALIEFVLPTRGEPVIQIFDLVGRRVADLSPGPLEAGTHSVKWNGSNDAGLRAAPGFYVARIRLGTRVATRRLALLY